MAPETMTTVGGAFACALALWAVAYAWGKWVGRPRPLPSPRNQDARLERIEAAVEAIAIEVERIGEAQRYATRVLAERAEAAAPSPQQTPYRPAITPH